jgi:hypothetical protein
MIFRRPGFLAVYVNAIQNTVKILILADFQLDVNLIKVLTEKIQSGLRKF